MSPVGRMSLIHRSSNALANVFTGVTQMRLLTPRSSHRKDNEFLPAAIEILETPPSPILVSLLVTIWAVATIALVGSFVGHIDVVAVAQGKIQPTGRVKLVQALESGKVKEVFVANGAKATEGQVVVALDDSEARAEELSLSGTLASLRAEIERRTAAIAAAPADTFAPPQADWPKDLPDNVVAREERILVGDLALLRASIEDLDAQRRQKETERKRLTLTIASQEALLKIEDKRVELRAGLESQGLGTKLALFDALETLQNQRSSLANQQGELLGAIAALDVLDHEKAKLVSTFVADNSQKLGEAQRQAAETAQKLAKAQAKTLHMTLQAPVSGTVQAVSITSIGQVLMPGEEVMRIVPDGVGFEIECYMPNKDIGFIRAGQEAVVKIESFPFTRYGTLRAYVKRVGIEAIPEPDAQQQEANPAKAARSTLSAGGQRMQNLVFPVTLSLEKTTITADGVEVPVSNGMAVAVEIKTGSRRVIDYVLSPLAEVASKAMKER
jgi:hemolysin D